MVLTQQVLKSERVVLEPLKDISYFADLAVKENGYIFSKEQIIETIETYGQEFWEVCLDGVRIGIVGYFIIDGIYLMEALKDHSTHPTGMSISVEVGLTVLEYLFKLTDEVRTFARKEDIAIQLLCRKVGFMELFRHDDYIIYGQRREVQCQ